MIVFDAYAVLAFLKGEPAADQVEQLMAADESVALTALGVSEVLDHLIRVTNQDEEEAVLDLAQLGLATPFAIDIGVAQKAGFLRARHYHRTTRALSLADCFAAEIARAADAQLATADPHLLDLCHDEDIDVIPLPDSSGRTWSP